VWGILISNFPEISQITFKMEESAKDINTLTAGLDESEFQFEVTEQPRSAKDENVDNEDGGTLGTLDWDEGEFALICRVLNSF
jgi:hypothetical protein